MKHRVIPFGLYGGAECLIWHRIAWFLPIKLDACSGINIRLLIIKNNVHSINLLSVCVNKSPCSLSCAIQMCRSIGAASQWWITTTRGYCVKGSGHETLVHHDFTLHYCDSVHWALWKLRSMFRSVWSVWRLETQTIHSLIRALNRFRVYEGFSKISRGRCVETASLSH